MEALSSHDSITTAEVKETSSDGLTFSLIFWITFLAFLVIAILSTLFRLPWRSWFPGAEKSSSLIRDVRAAVYTLMSHLT